MDLLHRERFAIQFFRPLCLRPPDDWFADQFHYVRTDNRDSEHLGRDEHSVLFRKGVGEDSNKVAY